MLNTVPSSLSFFHFCSKSKVFKVHKFATWMPRLCETNSKDCGSGFWLRRCFCNNMATSKTFFLFCFLFLIYGIDAQRLTLSGGQLIECRDCYGSCAGDCYDCPGYFYITPFLRIKFFNGLIFRMSPHYCYHWWWWAWNSDEKMS